MQYYAFLAPQIKALKRAFKIRLEIIEIISKISMWKGITLMMSYCRDDVTKIILFLCINVLDQ